MGVDHERRRVTTRVISQTMILHERRPQFDCQQSALIV